MAQTTAQTTASPHQPTLNALRVATRVRHEELEARSVLTNSEPSREMLRSYLLGVWPWLLAIEQGVWNGEWHWPESLSPDLRSRKIDWLQEDLLDLDCQAPPVPEPLRFTSRSEALGTAYVTEGMTLGGRVLFRRFESVGISLRFFAGYQAQTGAMWKALLAQLEDSGAQPHERGIMCDAAQAAFHSFP